MDAQTLTTKCMGIVCSLIYFDILMMHNYMVSCILLFTLAFSPAAHDPNRPAIQFMGCNPPVEDHCQRWPTVYRWTEPGPNTRHVSAHSTHFYIYKKYIFENHVKHTQNLKTQFATPFIVLIIKYITCLLVLSNLWSISPKIRLISNSTATI